MRINSGRVSGLSFGRAPMRHCSVPRTLPSHRRRRCRQPSLSIASSLPCRRSGRRGLLKHLRFAWPVNATRSSFLFTTHGERRYFRARPDSNGSAKQQAKSLKGPPECTAFLVRNDVSKNEQYSLPQSSHSSGKTIIVVKNVTPPLAFRAK